MTNCNLSNNTAEKSKSGITVACNETRASPPLDDEHEVKVILRSCIVWGNLHGTPTPNSHGDNQLAIGDNLCTSATFQYDAEYCIVKGGGGANVIDDSTIIDSDPLYMAAGSGDFHLDDGSPGFNAGQISEVPADDFDLDDDADTSEETPDLELAERLFGYEFDLGVYESTMTCCRDFKGDDGQVGIGEFLMVLAEWGPCDPGPPTTCETVDCLADIDRDCTVGILDFLWVLANWDETYEGQAIPCDPTSGPVLRTYQVGEGILHAGSYGPVSDVWGKETNPSTPPTFLPTDRFAADDFRPTADATITNLFWYGFYDDEGSDCTSGYTCRYKITYYGSVEHGTTGERVPDFSNVIANFTDVDASRQDSGLTAGVGGPTIYVYNFSHTGVEVDEGVCYFVQIRNGGGDNTGATGCHWRWAWSDEGDDLYSCFKPEDEDNYEDTADPGIDMNLAFGLNIDWDTEDPETDCSN